MPKTIIITGANGNLGTAVVKKFLEEGHKVIAVDHSGSHLGFADRHPNFELHGINLTDETESPTFVKEAASLYGRIDGGILLAGGFEMGGIDTTDGAALKRMFSLNFETAYYLARPLFQHMLQNGYGRLVFTGARPGLNAAEGTNKIAYALSKSLLFTLADILNQEAKGKNVTVSVIAPSTIDTPPNRQSMPDANFNNWVKPEQIAEVLAFICSDKGEVLREPVYKVYNNA
jgi:NAD(P)-dependent dehydrogenase (short-subunit alcohol dehydrogenase family)